MYELGLGAKQNSTTNTGTTALKIDGYEMFAQSRIFELTPTYHSDFDDIVTNILTQYNY